MKRNSLSLFRLLFACCCLVMLPLVARAATIYLSVTGSDNNDGLSWATAKGTISNAVRTAREGSHETVLVDDGTYASTGSLNLNAKISLRSMNGPTETVIQKTPGINIAIATINHAEAQLIGFTLTGSRAADGAGVYMTTGLVANCIISNNVSTQLGGGLFMRGGVVSNCIITANSNTAGVGAGVFMTNESLLIDSEIYGNLSVGNGGGIYARNHGPRIERCKIYDNYSALEGGGIYTLNPSDTTIRNSHIFRNTANVNGGGVVYFGTGTFANCTIVDNFAVRFGGGLYLNIGASVNNIVYANSSGNFPDQNVYMLGGVFEYGCTYPELAGDGNISDDPLFMDAATGDYRLAPGSLCRDAGEYQEWMDDAVDLDMNPRLVGPVDMGAYEDNPADWAFRCAFTATPTHGYDTLEVHFVPQAFGPITTDIKYGWDFGDDTKEDGSDLLEVVHTYDAPGIYSVSLTLTNDAAQEASFTRKAYIRVGPSEIYVSPNGLDQAPFTNWATATTNINWAIVNAKVSDTILVAGGTYVLDSTVLWSGASNVTVMGGYEGVTNFGRGARDPEKWPSILTRNEEVRTYMRIMSMCGVTNGVLDGLRLQNGWTYRPLGDFPGAALEMRFCTNMVLRNCYFTDSHVGSPDGGGGLFLTNSTGEIAECVIARNFIDHISGAELRGAGLLIVGGVWTVRDSIIADNMNANRIVNHTTHFKGSGIHIHGGRHRVFNSLIYGNGAANFGRSYYHELEMNRYGSGLYVNAGTVRVDNCTIAGNVLEGVSCTNAPAGLISLTNCIVWGHEQDVVSAVTNISLSHCNIGDGTSHDMNGCFSNNPMFERGFYLSQENSPCVDAGSGPAFYWFPTPSPYDYTTSTNGEQDTGIVDIGFHNIRGLDPLLANLHVSPEGDDDNAGTNWWTAMRTITKALTRAAPGTHINVAPGIYDMDGEETFPLTMRTWAGLQLLGSDPATTIIDARNANTQAVFISGVAPDARFAGFTVANAMLTNSTGAGITALGSTLEVADSRIVSNVISVGLTRVDATQSDLDCFGAGLAALFCRLVVTNSVFYDNSVMSLNNNVYDICGGGIGLLGGRNRIQACEVIGNSIFADTARPRGWGAGIYAFRTIVDVQNTVIANNRGETIAQPMGDGMFVGLGNATVRNCTIAWNFGEGLRAGTNGALQELALCPTYNSIFWNNGGDDIVFSPPPSPGLPMDVWHSSIQDHDNLGLNGCVTVEPAFANPPWDFHQVSRMGRWYQNSWVTDLVDSACIDLGDPNSLFDEEPEPNGGRINLGAYGNTAQASKTFMYPLLSFGPVLTNAVMRGRRAESQPYVIGVSNNFGRWVQMNLTSVQSWIDPKPVDAIAKLSNEQIVFTNHYFTQHLGPGTNIGYALVEAWDEHTGVWCANSPALAMVVMQVMELARNVTNISCYGLVGNNPIAQPFKIWNAGAGPMQYNITTDVPWMYVTNNHGVSHSSSDKRQHYAVFDAEWLAAGGPYFGQIIIAATNGGGATAIIQMELTVGAPPEMVLNKHVLTNEVTIGFGGTNEFAVRRTTGEIPLEWSCEIVNGAEWMVVSPTNGRSSGEWDNIQISFSPNLSPGVHKGLLRVKGKATGYDNPAIGSPREIEVFANAVKQASLGVSPAAIAIRTVEGIDPPSQAFGLINSSGKGLIHFELNDNVPWLISEPESGVIERGAMYTNVMLHFSTEALDPGRYEGRLVVTATDMEHGGEPPGSPAIVPLTLEVTPLAVLELDRYELTQTVHKGGQPDTQVFRVRNASPPPRGALLFNVGADIAQSASGSNNDPQNLSDARDANARWLSVTPASATSVDDWIDVHVVYEPANMMPGLHQTIISVRGVDAASGLEAANSPLEVLVSLRVLRPSPGDFTGNTLSDLTLIKNPPGLWYVYSLEDGVLAWELPFGAPDYRPMLADFDGDGRADLGLFRPVSSGWYARRLWDERLMVSEIWGAPGFIPVLSDFDGDTVVDIGVYDPATGLWYIRGSDGSILAWGVPWGGPGLLPVPGDYDGDAISDLAVYSAAAGAWYIISLNGNLIAWDTRWGGADFLATTGDFDADGNDDLAVFRPSTGSWFVCSLTKGVLLWDMNWGGPGFTPVLGDFDGDGTTDFAAYHEATGTWYARSASGILLFWGLHWGGPGLKPL